MTGWTRLASLHELQARGRADVEVGGRDIAVLWHQGRVVALWNRCPHANGRVADGEIKDDDVVCPLHRWRFSLTTGKTMRDRRMSATLYPVRVDGDDVLVDLP